MHSRNWFSDFVFEAGAVRVRKSGARVALNADLLDELARWTPYFLSVRALLPVAPKPAFTIAFTPERPRPWYLIWPVVRLAGGRIVDDPAAADVVMHFEDATEAAPSKPTVKPGARLMNFDCPSISKSAVAAASAAAFGYPLAVDPRVAQGLVVEKSELNAAHDGRIVETPLEPAPGRVYQRLIDNRGADGLVEDLRTPTLGGKPLCVFIKRRRVDLRFTNHNAECILARVSDVFTPEEIAGLGRFTASLGLDWGGLDVLRDARDGRIYVVDANKTDMGPPIVLPLREQLQSTRTMAAALRAYVMATA